jgi:glutaredoxin
MTTTVPIHVVMYTRRGCHLCDDAWQLLEELRGRFRFQLEAIDVDGEADLVARYGERVPVVVVNGTERFWGRINRVLVERLLRAGK